MSRDAFAVGTHEESGPHVTQSSAADPELVPSAGRGFRRSRGGTEQQGEIGDEKIVRFPNPRSGKTCVTSQSGTSPRARIYPQILLRRLFFLVFAGVTVLPLPIAAEI